MSYLGLVVTSAFASNALLAYGFGSLPGRKATGGGQLAAAAALAIANALASSLMWCIGTLALAPLGLASLDLLFFALIALPLIKFAARAASGTRSRLLAPVGEKADDLMVGSLVFGIALVSSRSGFTLPQAVAASAASGLGYWLATFLLGSIRERLELSDLPRPFRGGPALLVSAGLIALAFMGLDAAFVKGLAG